jgi:phage regulator Rha-like protein
MRRIEGRMRGMRRWIMRRASAARMGDNATPSIGSAEKFGKNHHNQKLDIRNYIVSFKNGIFLSQSSTS